MTGQAHTANYRIASKVEEEGSKFAPEVFNEEGKGGFPNYVVEVCFSKKCSTLSSCERKKLSQTRIFPTSEITRTDFVQRSAVATR